ncbi:MAG: NTP transferase domain-containing protein [Caldilineaceae bacterium]|nr:NTP transferase domain-containing protein [Caldilineaceae bacterium]MCB0121517.1 NTP transferase domain-containing protein [Caldilineaceae bacterium]
MQEELIGLIPAAGKGVRLGLPYPKELYPVVRRNGYRPVAQFVLENLTTAGLRHIVFVINESKHQLIGYFGAGQRFDCQISYVVQEQAVASQSASTSPGLAHALDSAYHLVRHKTVFFGMADTIMQPAQVFARGFAAAQPEDDVILILFPTLHPEKFGMVHWSPDGRVQAIVDKPQQTELTEMWGCIIWRPTFTEYLHEQVCSRGIADFAQIMNNAIADGLRFRAAPISDGTYVDLGTYAEIAEFEQESRNGVSRELAHT